MSTIVYYKNSDKTNYLKFDFIFIIMLLMVGFVYPVFLFNEKYPYMHFFGLTYNFNDLITGTILFAIGIQSYFIGSSFVKYKDINYRVFSVINTKYLKLAIFMLSFLLYIFGAANYFKNIYQNTMELSAGYISQTMVLFQVFNIVLISTEYYNYTISRHKYKIDIMPLAVVGITALMMLIAGNRSYGSQLLLPGIILFGVFKRNIGFKTFIGFMVLSGLIMWTIQVTRTGEIIRFNIDVKEVISDVVIPTRNNYICVEYVNKYGFTWGGNMVGGLGSIIPNLSTKLVKYFNVNPRKIGSAEIFTDYTFGQSAPVGLGTTIVADIYLSFGLFGVIILMSLLGYVSKRLYKSSLQLSYYSIIMYAAIASYAVFWVRSTYTDPLKAIIWCYLIAQFNKRVMTRTR